MESKGKEVNEYREKHGLRIQGEENTESKKAIEGKSNTAGGVLVH